MILFSYGDEMDSKEIKTDLEDEIFADLFLEFFCFFNKSFRYKHTDGFWHLGTVKRWVGYKLIPKEHEYEFAETP